MSIGLHVLAAHFHPLRSHLENEDVDTNKETDGKWSVQAVAPVEKPLRKLHH